MPWPSEVVQLIERFTRNVDGLRAGIERAQKELAEIMAERKH